MIFSNAHRELVDADFVQVMEAVAANMAEKGESNAGWLQNLAAQLANYVRSTATPEEYLSFLMEVLQATHESRRKSSSCLSYFTTKLRQIGFEFCSNIASLGHIHIHRSYLRTSCIIAAVIGNFGNLIQQFPLGRRAWNLEIGIACYTAALKVYTRENYPEYWATTQNYLGAAYSNRIEGVRAANIEEAIACYTAALEVYTRENYPEDWAMTQNNLGIAYSDRIEGVRAANIEQAIACYREALKVRTPENYPEKWAMTQNNLGMPIVTE
ncbi:MAG: tetratricopeptide repeat protein [Microcoleus sp.]